MALATRSGPMNRPANCPSRTLARRSHARMACRSSRSSRISDRARMITSDTVTPHMHVDEKELAEIENVAERFATFTFERIEKFPDLPGHSDTTRRKRFPHVL